MKADKVPIQSLLKGIPLSLWGIGWEAILYISKKNLDFKTQGRIYAYIKKSIKGRQLTSDCYCSRIKDKETGLVEKSYIPKFIPFSSTIPTDVSYQDALDYANYIESFEEESILRCDLAALGISEEFINRILLGEKIAFYKLNLQEKKWVMLLRKIYS